jgi:Arc/MetJ-type ribon-helix-helix transcriptional regulator
MSDRDNADNKSMSVNVRISGTLRDHVERTTSEGDYESVSEYVRDLIRKDKARREEQAFTDVKARLKAAFAEQRSSYETVSATQIRALARKRLGK